MHKGKKISLVPMFPTELLEYETDKAHNFKKKDAVPSENQQPIVLKQPSFLAKKYDLDEIDHCNDDSYYVLMCTQALCSFDGTPIVLFHDNNLSHVDLISTYHKLRLALVTPFVFTASHITFMRLMIEVSCAVISNVVLVYLDDIFFYRQHPGLNDLCTACFFANLANRDKYIFCAFRVHFLGYALIVQDHDFMLDMLMRRRRGQLQFKRGRMMRTFLHLELEVYFNEESVSVRTPKRLRLQIHTQTTYELGF